MNKKAVLGFVLVLLLTLALAGLTFYKIAQIMGLYQTNKALTSYQDLVSKMKEVSGRSTGTKESMPLYIDEKSAIIGFSNNSQEVIVRTGINHYSPRPRECESSSKTCICLCRNYDWDIALSWNYLKAFNPVRCRGELYCTNFTDFDFPYMLTKDDFGLDYGSEGGFIIARKLGSGDVEYRLKGVYITNERQAPTIISVSFNENGISKESANYNSISYAAAKIWNDARSAYGKKEYSGAIKNFENLIGTSDLFKTLTDSQRESSYFLRAMAYYQIYNADKTNSSKIKALEVLKDTLSYVEGSNCQGTGSYSSSGGAAQVNLRCDPSLKAEIQEKINELEAVSE